MRGRLLGDFVADYATGVASVKLLQGVKKLAKVTNFTVALKTIAAVENGFAAMSNVVNKLPNAVLKKVGTRANITAKLLVNGTTELLSYTQKVIKVPAANWLTNTSGWTYISSIAGEYIDQAGKRVKGYLKIYETTCLIGNSIVANPSARVEASATEEDEDCLIFGIGNAFDKSFLGVAVKEVEHIASDGTKVIRRLVKSEEDLWTITQNKLKTLTEYHEQVGKAENGFWYEGVDKYGTKWEIELELKGHITKGRRVESPHVSIKIWGKSEGKAKDTFLQSDPRAAKIFIEGDE